METLAWVQDTAFATWLRESSWALFASLILHTLGMGLLVGTSLAAGARVLGLASGIPLTALQRLRPVLGWSLAAAVFSGVMLVTAYPAKALTNPFFYVKLVAVSVALAATLQMIRSPARGLAMAAMPLWLAGLTLGRFLAYTHKVLLVY